MLNWLLNTDGQWAVLALVAGWMAIVVFLQSFLWLATVRRALSHDDAEALPFMFPLQFSNDLLLELTFLSIRFLSPEFFILFVFKGGLIIVRDSGVAEDFLKLTTLGYTFIAVVDDKCE